MRLEQLTVGAMLAGTLACAPGQPGVEDEGGTSTDETDGNDNGGEAPEPECLTDSDCPEDFVCIGQEYCEPLDTGPCECNLGEVCIEEECVAIEGLPACAPIEVTSAPTFMLPGDEGDFVLADVDDNGGLELVGVSLTRAITWFSDGSAIESPLTFPGGTSLQLAALRVNEDATLDLAVTIPSVHILYQLAGDGAGGFANESQRNFGGNPPWDVARLRTSPDVDGMIVKLALDDASEQWLFFDVAASVQPEQVLEGYIDRWPADLDGDGIDELIIHRDDTTSILRIEAGTYVEVAQLPSMLELPGMDPWTEHLSCDGFAAGDLDGDAATDIVCIIRGYASSPDHGVLVPFFQTGAMVFERGEPSVVDSSGPNVRFFDLEGDGSPELLLNSAVVDVGPDGSFACSSPQAIGFGEVGNLDDDAADEVVTWGAPQAPYIHDLAW